MPIALQCEFSKPVRAQNHNMWKCCGILPNCHRALVLYKEMGEETRFAHVNRGGRRIWSNVEDVENVPKSL